VWDFRTLLQEETERDENLHANGCIKVLGEVQDQRALSGLHERGAELDNTAICCHLQFVVSSEMSAAS